MKPNNEKGGKKSMLKKSKRFLAGFLAFLLVVTMVPTDMLSVVYAEEDETVTAEAPESVEQNDEADEVIDDVKADDADEVVDDVKADEVIDDVKTDDADEVIEDVKADNTADEVINDVKADEADKEVIEKNDDLKDAVELTASMIKLNSIAAGSENSSYTCPYWEGKEPSQPSIAIPIDSSNNYDASEYTVSDFTYTKNEEAADKTGTASIKVKGNDNALTGEVTINFKIRPIEQYFQGGKPSNNWSVSASDSSKETRDTEWDFTSGPDSSFSLKANDIINNIKVIATNVSFKSGTQGLSLGNVSGVVAIPLDAETETVKVTLYLSSNNSKRSVVIGDGDDKITVAHSDFTTSGDFKVHTETCGTNCMTTDGDGNKWLYLGTLVGETKFGKIEITETRSKAATPTAAFKADGEPALSVSKDSGTTCEELHPGDKLTVAYELDLADDDADASDIVWTRVKEGSEPEVLTADADDTTGKTYTVVEADLGSKIKVTVTPKIDGYDNGEPASDTSDEVTALEDGFITDPYFEINGDKNETEANVGDTLTVKYETGHDETRQTEAIAWYRVAADKIEDLEIDGIADNNDAIAIEDAADSKTYTLTEDDEENIIVAVVSLTDANAEEVLTGSCQTENAVAAWAFGFSVKPALASDGEDEDALYPGDTLTVSYTLNKETADDISVIEWYRCKDGDEEKIDNDTSEDPKKYTVTTDDIGYTIKVTVTPKIEKSGEETEDPTGDPESAETKIAVSGKVVEFTTDPSFSISTGGNLAYPQPGDKLTVAYELDKAEDETDESVITWTRVNGETETPLTADTVEGDGLGKTYTIVTDDIGCTIKVSVTPKTDNENVSAGDPKTYTSNEVREAGYTPTTAYNMSLKASDIPSGTYTSTVVKNGFTINAGSDAEETKKSVAVDANSKTIGYTDGDTWKKTDYTARLKMSGPGEAGYRSVSFTAVKEATLEIACMASNDSTPAKLAIATANNGTLTEYTGSYKLEFNKKDGSALADGNSTVSGAYTTGGITINNKLVGSDAGGSYITVKLPAGTYYLYTPDANASAVNFYEIKVTYEDGEEYGNSEYYTVTFNKNGGMNDIASQKVLKGEKCLAPAGPVKDGGYKFKGWYIDAEQTAAFDFSTVLEGNLTLYAGWEEDPDYENLVLDMKDLPQGDYTTSFNYHGFTLVGASGKALSVASSSANVDGKDYTQVLKFGGTGADTSRYIKFETTKKSTVTIVAIKGGNDGDRKLAINGSVDKNSATYSEVMESTTQAQKWVTENVPAGTWYVYSMNSGINIYYISVVEEGGSGDSYTVDFKDNDGSALSSPIASKTTTGTLNLSEVGTPSKSGYIFKGWTTEPNGTTVEYTATETVTITANTTLYAVWEAEGPKVTYTVTLMNGETKIDEVTVEAGQSLDLTKYEPAKTEDGKICNGWSLSPDATEVDYETGIKYVTDNMTLYAVMVNESDATYKVIFNNWFTGDEEVQTVKKGTEITLPDPGTHSGYNFIGWYNDNDVDDKGETKYYQKGDKYTVNGSVYFDQEWDYIPVPQTGMDVRFDDPTYAGGVAVLPKYIDVYYKGRELTQGVDYTVKGKNNKNATTAAKPATLTVIGIGNYKGVKKDVTFNIIAKDIGGEDEGESVKAPYEMTLIQGAKVNPVITYKGKQLKLGKDFTLKEGSNIDAKGKYTGKTTAPAGKDEAGKEIDAETRTMVVTGIGNYRGTKEIEVKVVDKANAKQLAVNIDKNFKPVYGDDTDYDCLFSGMPKKDDKGDYVFDENGNLTYDETTKKITVVDKKSKTAVTEGKDFEVVYSSVTYDDDWNFAAGTVKFTVVGIGEYTGNVSKSFKISPRKDAEFKAGVFKEWSESSEPVFETSPTAVYSNSKTGATLSNLRVYKKVTEKDSEGKEVTSWEPVYSDYTVSYSGNKKAGAAAKAKINFTGNYKGTKALEVPFTVTGAMLPVNAYAADMTYAKPGKSYVSKPILEYAGTILKASEYKATYEWVSASKYGTTDDKGNDTTAWTPDDKVKITLDGADTYAVVRVTIKPSDKSNFVLDKETQTGADGKETEVDVPVYAYYTVRKADGGIDLSKAKVEFYSKLTYDKAAKKATYSDADKIKAVQFCRDSIWTPSVDQYEYESETGTGAVKKADDAVYVKVTVNKEVVDPSLYDVDWICNYNAGKATVIITGKGPSEAPNAAPPVVETQADEPSGTPSTGGDTPTTPTTKFAAGGKTVTVKIDPIKKWIEPEKVAETVKNALKNLF